MTIFKNKPTYRGELKECYRLIAKLRDFTKKKNPNLRKKLLLRSFGSEPTVRVLLSELSNFVSCRAAELETNSPVCGRKAAEIGRLLEGLIPLIDAQMNTPSVCMKGKDVGRICTKVTELAKSDRLRERFTLRCVTEHRIKAEVAAVYLWGQHI